MSKKGTKGKVSENFDEALLFHLSSRYCYVIISLFIKIRYDYRLINFT